MSPGSFTAAATTWQSFYLLVGTSAATLIGLMFVAITFGSSLVTKETSASARSFIDPTFTHFVQVLVTACLFTIPTLGPRVLGALVLGLGVLRAGALVRVFRHMKEAQRVHQDIELSDWLMGIVLPLTCHVAIVASGIGFLMGWELAFSGLAIVTLAILLNGVFGAWELVLWMALTRNAR